MQQRYLQGGTATSATFGESQVLDVTYPSLVARSSLDYAVQFPPKRLHGLGVMTHANVEHFSQRV